MPEPDFISFNQGICKQVVHYGFIEALRPQRSMPTASGSLPKCWQASPLPLYRRLERGKEKATYHPLYFVLRDMPNLDMTSFTLRETLMSHLLLWGNASAQVEIFLSGNLFTWSCTKKAQFRCLNFQDHYILLSFKS